jgi:hypothetical protein
MEKYWNFYTHIIGNIFGVILIAIALIILLKLIHWRFTRTRCPKCNNIKFNIMIGGPPRCIKCGWQEATLPGEVNPTNFKRRNGYYIIGF